MLPKQHRLPGHLIPQILKTGRWFRGELFDLILLPASNLELLESEPRSRRPRTSNFTIIVPQKLSKKSVKRHRAKRLLVEAVHKNLSQLKPGYQVILMAKKILEKEKLQDIMPEVKTTLEKAKILRN